ncbi:Major facilitator superfamily domain-containing protein 8 [Auxenochlorella protothecoides]|uniref:Major facilitator superfamily domain-containing protein 8 n=1 Tax=Auxenochlorella protothecoides TaxID=3075 RepID=A0A087SH45_AUXPR|nr:Major facilitator superfamily domain-containing protein 8 [Auxenochlorella protothecoides]KFM25049.1 Major facilitator superfamily domain-containing protein 8 [Auxenochlorella protothecoides]
MPPAAQGQQPILRLLARPTTPAHAPTPEESLLDLPADPEHARTKKWSYWALVIVGFALAVDYSSTLMSIQPLYYLVNGRQSLYGLTFGSYDLASLIFAPVFGWWVDRTNRFKGATLLGVALNAVGNYIYGFTVLAGEWWLMLLARLVAGAGAAVLGIGGSYITRTSTLRKRQAKLGRYRITQNVARSVGPLIGFMFLGLPSPTFSSSDAIKVFNWYTIPGWLAGFIVTALCFFYIWGFTDPTAENEHFVQEEGVPFMTDAARRRNFQVFFGVWITLCGLVSMLTMAQYSNLFGLFAGQYRQIFQQSDVWRAFIAAGGGSIGAAIVYRRGMRRLPQLFNERTLLLVTGWGLVVGFLLLIPYKGSDWVPPPALFYVGTAFLGASYTLSMTCMETFLSKKVTQFADVVGNNIGKYLSLFYMAISAGRFAGPLIVGSLTRISTPNGDTFVCTTGWIYEPTGDVLCTGPADQQCGVTASDYYLGGCVLYRALPVYAAMAGMQGVVIIVMQLVLWRNWSYKNRLAGEKPLPSPALKTTAEAQEHAVPT